MKKAIISLSLIGFTSIGFSQISATTSSGKKVTLKSNGTWEYLKTNTKSSSISLSCEDLISEETDKVTGRKSIAAKENIILSQDGGKTGFGIFIMKSTRSMIFSTKVVGSGCIEKAAKMNILFRDGSKTTLYHKGDFNCKGKHTVYLGGAFGLKKQLSWLKTKEVETIRVWTSSSYVQEDLSPAESKQLMKTFMCLTDM